MPITNNDHEQLHRSVGLCALVGGALGLAGLWLPTPLWVALCVLLWPIAVSPPRSFGSLALAIAYACAAGAGVQLGGVFVWIALPSFGLAVSRDQRSMEKTARRFAGGAIGAGLAWFIHHGLTAGEVLAGWPVGFEALTLGAVAGMPIGLSTMSDQLELTDGTTPPPLPGPPAAAVGEVGKLLLRARSAHRETCTVIGEAAPAARAAADQLADRIERFGQTLGLIEVDAVSLPLETLSLQLEGLDQKILITGDLQARGEYAEARRAVAAELECCVAIGHARDRAVARLTRQVTLLEQLRLQAVRHRSVDAARLSAELGQFAEELARAGADLDLESEVLGEGEYLKKLLEV
jgi:hypothetical protein